LALIVEADGEAVKGARCRLDALSQRPYLAGMIDVEASEYDGHVAL
jgi:hypothetical protein